MREELDAGEIIASGRCSGLATWVIKVKPGHQVLKTLKGMYAVWICYGRNLPEVECHTNAHV